MARRSFDQASTDDRLDITFQKSFVDRGIWRLALRPQLDVAAARTVANAPEVALGTRSCLLHSERHPRLAAKLIQYRSLPRDAIRKYTGGQARREYLAARKLRAWDIPCPTVWGYAFSLNPFAQYESLLLLDYHERHRNARRYLETSTDHASQWTLLTAIARDIAAIYSRGYHHNDCHLGNVLVDRQGRHVWIDNELRRIRSPDRLTWRFEQSLLLLEQSFKNSVDSDTRNTFLELCRTSAEIPTMRG